MTDKKDNLETIGDYWTQRSEGFSEHMLEHMEEDAKGLYITLIKEFSDTRKMKVLDIGTGPGLFPIILGKDGHDVTAIDYSDGMLELAAKNCKERGVDCKILKMDAQNLEFEDKSFDLIVSRKVLWNLEEPVRAYREWLRVLKDDGKMILFDANWWLHFYDEEYKALHENYMEEMKEKLKEEMPDDACGSDYPHKYQGADPRILHEFAKELPLSRVRRPSWDVQTLSELGAVSIKVDIDRSSPSPLDDGRMLPDSFVLTVSKTRD
jgi:SAM-dependent methyltransferase